MGLDGPSGQNTRALVRGHKLDDRLGQFDGGGPAGVAAFGTEEPREFLVGFGDLGEGGLCCRTLSVEDSHRESMWLDGLHEQAITRPLSHDELVQLHGVATQAGVAADLAGQGDDLTRVA